MTKKKPVPQGKPRKSRKPTKQHLVFADKYIELGSIEKAAFEGKAESARTRIFTDWSEDIIPWFG